MRGGEDSVKVSRKGFIRILRNLSDMEYLLLLDPNKCRGCSTCEIVCSRARAAVKCDLCEGDPLCSKFCPSDAINYVRRDKISLMQRREGLEKLTEFIGLMITEHGKGA